jgi:hypothetical protein
LAAPNLKTPTTINGKTATYAVTATLAAALSNAAASGKALKINSIYAANIDGTNSADIDVSVYNGTTDSYIAKGITVPPKATQLLASREGYFYLEEGISLRAKASAASALTLIIGYEDIS